MLMKIHSVLIRKMIHYIHRMITVIKNNLQGKAERRWRSNEMMDDFLVIIFSNFLYCPFLRKENHILYNEMPYSWILKWTRLTKQVEMVTLVISVTLEMSSLGDRSLLWREFHRDSIARRWTFPANSSHGCVAVWHSSWELALSQGWRNQWREGGCLPRQRQLWSHASILYQLA